MRLKEADLNIPNKIDRLIATRKPDMSLEQPFYTDPEVFIRDMERIFRRYWLFAGHTSRIPRPGDYFLFNMGNDSVIIVRVSEEKVAAFHNTCRHRGSRICLTPEGHANSLVCPYHQWVYKRDGSLLSARQMPEKFDKTQFGLNPVHLQIIEGLIFISLAQDPPNFDPVSADLEPRLRPYDLARTKICHTLRYTAQSNWKLLVENARECNHCPPVHPEYCRIVGPANIDSQKVLAENAAFEAECAAHWDKLGIETRANVFLTNSWYLTLMQPYRKGFVSQSLDGQAVGPLLGSLPEGLAGALAILIYPTFWFESSSDYAMIQRFLPLGPTLTDVEMTWLVHQDAKEGIDYEVERVTAFWKATADQDRAICEHNQAGVNSSAYRPGPYAPVESDVEKFVCWYLSQVAD
jgi:glycine betaine catabolism A